MDPLHQREGRLCITIRPEHVRRAHTLQEWGSGGAPRPRPWAHEWLR